MDGIVLFIVVSLIAFFFIKYFSAEAPPAGTDSEFTWVTRNIDQVLVMFPNVNQSAVAWELSKNRSVEETIEKLLNEAILPMPPQDSRYAEWSGSSFAPSSTSNPNASTTNSSSEPTRDDLIKRYNLQNRVYAEGSNAQARGKYEWSKKREEREETLRKRKEDAILAARMNLMAKDSKSS